jgi:hypothetical protein
LTRPEGRIRLSEDDGPAATEFLGDDDDDDDLESRTGAGGIPAAGAADLDVGHAGGDSTNVGGGQAQPSS